jgi:hypothetical protein
MIMHITAQFDDDHADKLAYIQQQTNEEFGEILSRAIDLYYQQLQTPAKSPLDVFEEAGLVGCMEAEPDLSSAYKSHIQNYLENKQSQSRL